MSANSLVISPRVSEQTYWLAARGVYVFNVPKSSNKLEVKLAIEAQYEVSVIDINTTVIKGKMKASNRKGKQATYGPRKDLKKAYVRLKEGDKIKAFEEVE